MKHKFLPRKLNPDTEILVIGTFNPDIPSNSAAFFYSRGHTAFWELMSAIFGEKCLRYSSVEDKEAFIKRHKIDFTDLIETIDMPEEDAANYRDVNLDKYLNKANRTDVKAEIARLKHLKKVCFTRKTFSGLPHIQAKTEEVKQFCEERKITFEYLPSPANYGQIDPDKRFKTWKKFFKPEEKIK